MPEWNGAVQFEPPGHVLGLFRSPPAASSPSSNSTYPFAQVAPRVPLLSLWERSLRPSAAQRVSDASFKRRCNVNTASASILDLEDLLNRVDDDRELLAE